jgi:hypothetical protein
MRIRLLRKTSTTHGTYPMGTILNLTNSYCEKLIEQGKAERYMGEYPPKKKMKTQLFNPKNNVNN